MFLSGKYFRVQLEPTVVEHITELHLLGKTQALPKTFFFISDGGENNAPGKFPQANLTVRPDPKLEEQYSALNFW